MEDSLHLLYSFKREYIDATRSKKAFVSMIDRCFELLVSFLWECAGNLLLQHLAGPRDRFARKDRILLITGTTLRSPRVALGIVRVTISRLENGGTLPTEREILSRILRLGCIDYFRKIFRGGQLLGVCIKWRIKIYS